MGLNNKLVSQITIKSDVSKLHEQLRFRPHQLSDISPQIINSVELIHGQWGAVGSIMYWNFYQDSKKVVSKEMIEAVEECEGKKMIRYKVVGGDMLEVYKTFKFILEAKANIYGEDNEVTLTLEYEKKSEAMPEPRALMDVCLMLLKDIDRHQLLVPN